MTHQSLSLYSLGLAPPGPAKRSAPHPPSAAAAWQLWFSPELPHSRACPGLRRSFGGLAQKPDTPKACRRAGPGLAPEPRPAPRGFPARGLEAARPAAGRLSLPCAPDQPPAPQNASNESTKSSVRDPILSQLRQRSPARSRVGRPAGSQESTAGFQALLVVSSGFKWFQVVSSASRARILSFVIRPPQRGAALRGHKKPNSSRRTF